MRKKIAFLMFLAFSSSAMAADKLSGYVEAGGDYHVINGLDDDWYGAYVKGVVNTDAKNIWDFQLVNDTQFGENGTFIAAGNTHIWNDDWYSVVSVGTSSGGFFFPRLRLDGFIYKKWLEKRNLVNYIGIGTSKSKDVYRDNSLAAGVMYYFELPVIAAIGVRLNESDPGSVYSSSGFIALTYGQNKDYFITVRHGFGNESYQLIGNQSAIADFNSHETSLNLRSWFNDSWGMNAKLEYYSNPSYDRKGSLLGIFKEF